MGQTLSEPVVEKNSEEGSDECVIYGLSAMQGWRISMEDAHSAVLDLQAKYLAKDHHPTDPSKRLSFFGVYDGHGGEQMALYAGKNVSRIVTNQETFARGDIEQALKDGYLATDRAILEDPNYEEEVSGCTAAVAIVSKDKIRVANAGDSRSVLGVKGRAKPLSFDHKPQNEGEKARISAAGGFVDFGRVNGNLALSRALGDFEFKKSPDLSPEQQIVTAYPDVTTHEITEDDEFLVIACDGIWDCQSSQAVVEFVRRGIAAKQELHRICENLMDNCLASNSETGGVGCDNMTMIIVGFLNGKTKEEWYNMIAERVANNDGPCAPPEYAQFRGPGVRRQFDDSPDEYDPGLDSRPTGRSGRIILLGDGTELLTDMGDGEMFENGDRVSEQESTREVTSSVDEPRNEPEASTTEMNPPAPAGVEQSANASTTEEQPKTT
ncbi:protein phosphatase 2C [Coccidioides immitis RS]|uniref:Protein phosphatase 2C homolog 2 n=6 Tax=Coccidioides TaxID=5500 RepID=J3K9P7_COCIM|nr:protein phosphatase 2C [Coccidioides immitis RS]EFW23312.1 protein phosphatase 2C [Coccidioides posadasii str. Silveira]KMM68184.1 protein phosphatase 2C [Coccidioides posadasii RMSCC 3488]KMP04322.1 phosphatase 2C [Coccidioides immitis RMSCC 2394]KMU73454.1 phosphatase 2C [Coccidioides immitis RMSCC 3703]KMU87139.1 phosphatase 2C isoform gamma [Coccidioides immitis H538.4]